MLQIAEGIESLGTYSPFFLFIWGNHRHSVEMCRDRGFQYLVRGDSGKTDFDSSGEEANSFEKTIAPWTSLKNWIIAKLKKRFAVMFMFYVIQFLKDKRFASNLLSGTDVKCIILVGDRHVGVETALIQAGNLVGIPALIVPFGFSDEEGSVVYRRAIDDWQKIYGMETFLNRLTARIKPEWTYTQNGDTFLWNPPYWLLAARIAGIAPKRPWSLGGGEALRMAVESPYHRDNFLQQGVPAEKIFVSGKPRYDSAAEVWKNQKIERSQICRELNIDENKAMLVCAVPQMAEHDLLSWPEHWDEIDFLFSSLAELRPAVNAVLSLHPKSDFSKYAPRAEQFGLTLVRDHSYDQLIPVCDAFLATFSSTVTLAIACHKPVIVIDFYGLGYDFFDGMAGIVVCREHAKLVKALDRLFNDNENYQQMVSGQASSAKYWACFDGQATARILDEIEQLIEQGNEIQNLPGRQRRKKLPYWSQ